MTINLPITTRRLLLRDLAADDWEAVHAYASDPEVVRYMPYGPNTEQESRDFIARSLVEQADASRASFQMATCLGAGGELIGACSIGRATGAGLDEVSIGCVFRRDAWGQGYATEAARALIGFAFERLGAHRVHAGCDTRNTASARVLEKVGLRYEGTSRQDPSLDGWHEAHHYAIVVDDWRALRSPPE